MSSTEFHSGKAKKIQFEDGLSIREKVDVMQTLGFEFDYIDEDMDDISGPKFVWIRSTDSFYELVEHFEALDEDQDLCEATPNEDGSFNFILQFYNGGAGFGEVFEEVVNTLPKEEIEPELTEEQIEDNHRAFITIENEGIGYAVDGYCGPDGFLDPETRRLWKQAGDALSELQSYLDNFSEEI